MNILSKLIEQTKALAEDKNRPVDADTPLHEVLDSAGVLGLWAYIDSEFIEGVNLFRDHNLKSLKEIAEDIREALSTKQ